MFELDAITVLCTLSPSHLAPILHLGPISILLLLFLYRSSVQPPLRSSMTNPCCSNHLRCQDNTPYCQIYFPSTSLYMYILRCSRPISFLFQSLPSNPNSKRHIAFQIREAPRRLPNKASAALQLFLRVTHPSFTTFHHSVFRCENSHPKFICNLFNNFISLILSSWVSRA